MCIVKREHGAKTLETMHHSSWCDFLTMALHADSLTHIKDVLISLVAVEALGRPFWETVRHIIRDLVTRRGTAADISHGRCASSHSRRHVTNTLHSVVDRIQRLASHTERQSSSSSLRWCTDPWWEVVRFGAARRDEGDVNRPCRDHLLLCSASVIFPCNGPSPSLQEFIIILPAKAREYVFTGVGLCVCLCVCLWLR